MIRKMLMDILTGVDNQTFDHGRVLGLTSFIFYFVLAIASYVINHPWGAMDFASGVGTMAVGFGIHLKLKSDTEPQERV